MTSETRQILIGPGHQSWCFTHDPNLEGPETINETYDIRVDGLNILLREQRIILRPVVLLKSHHRIYLDGTVQSDIPPILAYFLPKVEEVIDYFLSIADYQIYVPGTIDKEEIIPSLNGGIMYTVRPIGDRTELADKITGLARELFPDFAGKLYFDK